MIQSHNAHSLSGIPGLLEDHARLLELECRFESEVGRQRLFSLALAAFCFVSMAVYLQFSVLYALWRLRVSFYAMTLGWAALWAGMGSVIYYRFGRRDPQAGTPFKGTREELGRTWQWMSTNLF